MPIEIPMPRLSDTMEHGTIIKWHIAKGDTVTAGDVLADVEVKTLHLLLRVADCLSDKDVLDRFVLLDLELVHQLGDALSPENPEQVVFQREVELGGARIALSSGTPPELVVNATTVVASSA